jgi:hypothetical protein
MLISGSATAATPPPDPVVGQSDDFDPVKYEAYAKLNEATRADKDKLNALADKGRSTGDWRAFDDAANARDKRLGIGGRVKHDPPVQSGGAKPAVASAIWGSFHYVAGVTQYPQETSYWCGPAAGKSILSGWVTNGLPGGVPSQQTMATKMGTTTNGTDQTAWAAGMNSYIWNNPNQPGGWIYKAASNQATMVTDIRGNIDANWGAGVNTVEISGGWRYNNHPTGGTIRHFIAAWGYDTSASTITLTDSAANSQFVPWPNAQPVVTMTNAAVFNYTNQSGGNKRGYSY